VKAPRESDLVRACLRLLALRGIPAWRQNAGRLRVERGGRTHFYQFAGAAGISDVLGVIPPSGRLLAVEVKQPGGRLRPAQARFLENVRRAGGLAMVVSDLRQLEGTLAALGRPRP
jgi:hypothetical protein